MGKAQDRGRKYDKSVAKDLGYKTQPGSGNTWGAKGDARKGDISGYFLIENKFYTEKYPFKLSEWQKHEDHAMKYKLEPVMLLGFTGENLEVAIMTREFYRSTWSKVAKQRPMRKLYNTTTKEGILTNHLGGTVTLHEEPIKEFASKGKESFTIKASAIRSLRNFFEEVGLAIIMYIGNSEFAIVPRREFELIQEVYES